VTKSLGAAQARSVDGLVGAMAAGAHPRCLFFWGHTLKRPGQLDSACLSQWWPAAFETDGNQFRSAEHYMMWRKARLFDDAAKAAQILAARSPAQAKALGRQVANFDDAVWARHRWDVVVTGSVAKFGGDPKLREYLLATGRRVLVEASPMDRIWGIGLAADSDRAMSPRTWRGLNLLGFALMEARERIA
jgi:ribA/ribD-fused uncharacterized protein